MGQNVWPTKETRENHTSGLVRTELDHSTSGFGCMFRWREHMELTVKLAGPRIGAIHGHRHGWRRWHERVQMRGLGPSRSCLAVGRLLPAVALPLPGLPAWPSEAPTPESCANFSSSFKFNLSFCALCFSPPAPYSLVPNSLENRPSAPWEKGGTTSLD